MQATDFHLGQIVRYTQPFDGASHDAMVIGVRPDGTVEIRYQVTIVRDTEAWVYPESLSIPR